VTPLKKLVVTAMEKIIGRYYEGPEPPAYIDRMVAQFAQDAPKATRAQWTAFALGLAQEAYRTGYTRGYEYTERTDDWHPALPPDVIADMMDSTWKDDGRGIKLDDPGAIVPDEPPTEGEVMNQEQLEDTLLANARDER